MINKIEEGNIKEGVIKKGGHDLGPSIVMNDYHFIMGLRKDKLSDNTTVIIVDDTTGEILGKVKVLPMKEEEILVQKTYTIRGYKKEGI